MPTRKHSGSTCKWRLLSDFLIDGLSSQEVSTSPSTDTSHQALPRRRLDSSPIILSPRKFVECLYCNDDSLPIFNVISTSHIQLSSLTNTSVIHTNIHSYIHAYTTRAQYHLYIIALITQSLVSLYPFNLILLFFLVPSE